MSDSNSGPAVGTPEHAAGMIAKGLGISYEDALKKVNEEAARAAAAASGAADTSGKPARPEHIPEKFWDAEKGTVRVEEMAKSYAEMERTRSTNTSLSTPANINQLPTIEQPGVDPAVARSQAVEAFQAKAAEDFTKNGGKLSDDVLKAGEALGFNKGLVHAFIAGQQALQQQYISGMYDAAGGKAEYDKMIAWAKGALDPAEAKTFDATLNAGNHEATKMAVRGLKARFDSITGRAPSTTVQPTNAQAAAAKAGFNSQSEMTAAMKDARYGRDPAYTAEVQSRVAAGLQARKDLGITVIKSGRFA